MYMSEGVASVPWSTDMVTYEMSPQEKMLSYEFYDNCV